MLLIRYDPNSSFDPTQVDGEIDPKTFVVRKQGGTIIGVIRGDVFDRDSVIQDMARVCSIRGRLGELVADLNTAYGRVKKSLEREEATVYNEYSGKITRGEIEQLKGAKATKDNVNSMVLGDERVVEANDRVFAVQQNRERAVNMQDSLIGLENALKKVLEYGEKAQ